MCKKEVSGTPCIISYTLCVKSHKADIVIRVWIHRLAETVSFVLFIVLLIGYTVRPDSLAALTFFPVWAWALLSMCLALFTLRHNKRALFICLAGWLLFVLVLAEEPKSLLHGLAISRPTPQTISQHNLVTVVSLNCAGGSIDAVREILPVHPDIVLLQEVPSNADMRPYAQELFGDNGEIAYGPDTAIVVKGKLEQTPLPRSRNSFMTAARIRLHSGFEANVICIRLRPPVIDTNILSPACWKNHREDRKARRKQIGEIVTQIDQIPGALPLILGGDFNVGANDGCLRALRSRVRDTFAKCGVGWGHTAINTIPLFRVDQIWAGSALKPVCVYAKKTKHSDHRMVICHLAIPQ